MTWEEDKRERAFALRPRKVPTRTLETAEERPVCAHCGLQPTHVPLVICQTIPDPEEVSRPLRNLQVLTRHNFAPLRFARAAGELVKSRRTRIARLLLVKDQDALQH